MKVLRRQDDGRLETVTHSTLGPLSQKMYGMDCITVNPQRILCLILLVFMVREV